MIKLTVEHPLELWERLGEIALTGVKEWDQVLGSRKLSYLNNFIIKKWPLTFEGQSLFWAVGYELKGSKMTMLFNSYVNPEAWENFKQQWRAKYKQRHVSLGMNFKREVSGKGGCLSCFELISPGLHKKKILVIHSKTAEYPKKFTADIRLISTLITELGIEDLEVHWSSSVVWITDQFLKGIRTVFGQAYFESLVGSKRSKELLAFIPGYVEPTQRRIENHYNELHPFEQDSGLKINPMTGKREKGSLPRGQINVEKNRRSI